MATKRSGEQKQAEEVGRRLRSVQLIKPLRKLLKQIHSAGCERDRAGNRKFSYDHYLSLLLLYFANPSLDSLRALQNASNWEKVRQRLKIPRVSLGSLSESVRVFDPALVRPILKELANLARPHFQDREAAALANLTAVDGSVFAALPRMAWALWMDAEHRGVKLHLQFHACKGVPGDAALTPAACSEPATLTSMLESGRLYVCDRGYASFELLRSILDAGSSLIIRVKNDIVVNVQEERPISAEAAGCKDLADSLRKPSQCPGWHMSVLVGRRQFLDLADFRGRELLRRGSRTGRAVIKSASVLPAPGMVPRWRQSHDTQHRS